MTVNFDTNLGQKIEDHSQQLTVGELAARSIQLVVKNNKDTISQCSKNILKLAEGIYYPNEYRELLKIKNQQRMLEFFINNHSFFAGYIESNKWTSLPYPLHATDKISTAFTLAKNANPSEALDELTDKLSLIDSDSVVQISQLKAIQSQIGKEKFNKLFHNSIHLGAAKNLFGEKALDSFCETLKLESEHELQIGDAVLIKNTPKYLQKHPLGTDRWKNCIVVSNNKDIVKYASLGTNEEGLTKKEHIMNLVNAYNAQPIVPAEVLKESTLIELGFKSCEDIKNRLDLFYSRPTTKNLPRHFATNIIMRYGAEINKSLELQEDQVTEKDLNGDNCNIYSQRINTRLIKKVTNTPIEKLNIEILKQ